MGDQNRRMSLQNVRLPSNLLKEIDIERMGKLTEDEGEFTEFLDGLDLEDLKSAQTKRQNLSDEILQTAVINCDKEPTFEEKKAQLREKILNLTDLKNDHSKKFEELRVLTSKGDHQSVLKELQKSLRTTEEESEVMADKFIGGSSDLSHEDFVAQFKEMRTLYWLRKVKAEKMEELVRNLRPVPVPRSPRSNSRTPVQPPYVTPLPPRPGNSLAMPHAQPPYHPGPPMAHPTQSMPPYSHHNQYQHSQRPPTSSMPMPHPGVPPRGHIFNPAASYGGYRAPPPPSRPAPYGSYPSTRPYY